MLFILLAVPFLIALAGLVFGKGYVTWKEFLVQLGAVTVVVGLGYVIALCSKSADTEIWNGVIVKKYKEREGCCHSYPCNCRQECSGSGKNQTCSEVCDTCYRHSHDNAFYAITSNNETAYSNTCNAPGDGTPSRFSSIRVGEPSAVEHSYDNYVKANPDTIIKRTGLLEKFKGKIPNYPQVYDYYRVRHTLMIGLNIPNIEEIDDKLFAINSRLGAEKKVNVILLLTNESDQNYLEVMREAWIGGKKNDILVVVGMPSYPQIAWTGVISWTKNEVVKINIRDRIVNLNTFDSNKVLDIIADEVQNGFVHRSWSEFNYLKSHLRYHRRHEYVKDWEIVVYEVFESVKLSVGDVVNK